MESTNRFVPGHAKVGGRQKGTTNNVVRLRRERLAEAERNANLAVGEFDGTAYDFLVYLYKHPAVPLATRLDAAKTASSYEKAKLAAIAVIDPSSVPTINIRDIRTELQLIEHKPGVVLDAVFSTVDDDESLPISSSDCQENNL